MQSVSIACMAHRASHSDTHQLHCMTVSTTSKTHFQPINNKFRNKKFDTYDFRIETRSTNPKATTNTSASSHTSTYSIACLTFATRAHQTLILFFNFFRNKKQIAYYLVACTVVDTFAWFFAVITIAFSKIKIKIIIHICYCYCYCVSVLFLTNLNNTNRNSDPSETQKCENSVHRVLWQTRFRSIIDCTLNRCDSDSQPSKSTLTKNKKLQNQYFLKLTFVNSSGNFFWNDIVNSVVGYDTLKCHLCVRD